MTSSQKLDESGDKFLEASFSWIRTVISIAGIQLTVLVAFHTTYYHRLVGLQLIWIKLCWTLLVAAIVLGLLALYVEPKKRREQFVLSIKEECQDVSKEIDRYQIEIEKFKTQIAQKKTELIELEKDIKSEQANLSTDDLWKGLSRNESEIKRQENKIFSFQEKIKKVSSLMNVKKVTFLSFVLGLQTCKELMTVCFVGAMILLLCAVI